MSDNYIHRTTWEDVGAYLNAVAERVDPKDFSGVYGIPRGGCVLAAWLSHKLYLPLLSEPEPGCIVIDNVCDGGRALKECLDSEQIGDVNDIFVTVMFYNQESYERRIDYYYKQKEDDWIVFPYEQ